MKVHLESTTKIVKLNGEDCRIWEGVTEAGVKVHAFIPRIAADILADQSQFVRELRECRAPSEEVAAYPFRMIL